MSNEDDIPLSQSSVSLKLSMIQKRCAELASDGDEFGGLSLEEPVTDVDKTNPYDLG